MSYNFSKLIILFCLFPLLSFSQDKPAYKIYNSKGKEVSWKQLIKKSEQSDLVFFGEQHNDPIGHWLELQLTKDLYAAKEGQIMLGAEMFESDNQIIMNELLSGMVPIDKFEADTRLWDNYNTDYKPLIDFALENNLQFIASNVPRRYASMVYKGGFEALDSLSETAKSFIAPLPITFDPSIPSYADILKMSMGHGMNSENLAKAQAIKDATMAYNILKYRQDNQTFIHFNGAYHSQNKEGIVWYINKMNPELSIITITTELQEDINEVKEEYLNKADFIILVPEDMTRTY
jgi:uncharacterized iron-regulated protein